MTRLTLMAALLAGLPAAAAAQTPYQQPPNLGVLPINPPTVAPLPVASKFPNQIIGNAFFGAPFGYSYPTTFLPGWGVYNPTNPLFAYWMTYNYGTPGYRSFSPFDFVAPVQPATLLAPSSPGIALAN